MCASVWVANPFKTRNESEGGADLSAPSRWEECFRLTPGLRTIGRSCVSDKRFESERTCWDPKDGELCVRRAKPEETLVEARSGSDVQIDRQIWA